jgi:outer membrane protease
MISVAMMLMLISAPIAFCEEVASGKNNYSLSMGWGFMAGHTTYQVGGHYETPETSGDVRFPISELEFPLDIQYGSLGAEIELAERIELKAKIKKNISKDAGIMKDSDWGIRYEEVPDWPYPDSLDIYSESDTEADTLTADIAARYYLNPWQHKKTGVSVFIGVKYSWQRFEFIMSDLDQRYPSMEDYYGFEMEHVVVSGKVMEYKVTKTIPALIAGAQVASVSGLFLDAVFGYSPYTTVNDEDRHLLRSVTSKSDCEGNAVLLSVSGQYRFGGRWSLGLAYDYTAVDTEGEEKQYVDGQYSATIEQKNFSDLHAVELTLGFLF